LVVVCLAPAIQFIDQIKIEASKWAQPISMSQVHFEPSALGSDAALFGAAYLTMKNK
jgi:glucokinase